MSYSLLMITYSFSKCTPAIIRTLFNLFEKNLVKSLHFYYLSIFFIIFYGEDHKTEVIFILFSKLRNFLFYLSPKLQNYKKYFILLT